MTINKRQDEIIEEFSGFDDWMDKYQLLIDLGNEQQPLDEKYKTEQNLIDGCQSRVWLQADYDVLVKILLNEKEATLPLNSSIAPYYHWSDVRQYFLDILSLYKD